MNYKQLYEKIDIEIINLKVYYRVKYKVYIKYIR